MVRGVKRNFEKVAQAEYCTVVVLILRPLSFAICPAVNSSPTIFCSAPGLILSHLKTTFHSQIEKQSATWPKACV